MNRLARVICTGTTSMSTSPAPIHGALAARHPRGCSRGGPRGAACARTLLDDLTRWTEGLTDAEVHAQPLGLPSIAFHLRHIARSTDRILTYAEGEPAFGGATGRTQRPQSQRWGRESETLGDFAGRGRSLVQRRGRPHSRARDRGSQHACALSVASSCPRRSAER